jgi:hypothetical protein
MYKIQCEHCKKTVEFEILEIAELDEYIDRTQADAREGGFVDGLAAQEELGDARIIQELSSAIACGDLAEARYLIDQLCAEAPGDWHNANQLGQFGKAFAT